MIVRTPSWMLIGISDGIERPSQAGSLPSRTCFPNIRTRHSGVPDKFG